MIQHLKQHANQQRQNLNDEKNISKYLEIFFCTRFHHFYQKIDMKMMIKMTKLWNMLMIH